MSPLPVKIFAKTRFFISNISIGNMRLKLGKIKINLRNISRLRFKYFPCKFLIKLGR